MVLATFHGARGRSTMERRFANLVALYARARLLVRPIVDLMRISGRKLPQQPNRLRLRGCIVRYATSRSWGTLFGKHMHLLVVTLARPLRMEFLSKTYSPWHPPPTCSNNASCAEKPIRIACGVTTSRRKRTNGGKSSLCYARPTSVLVRTRAALPSRMRIRMWTLVSSA